MKQRQWRTVARAFAIMSLLAALCCLGAMAQGGARPVALNERIVVPLSQEPVSLTFSVPSNSSYTFRSFGGEGATAELLIGADGLHVASGEGFAFTERLIADKQYTLNIAGTSGEATVEIMRDALGRSFDKPLEIRNLSEGYTKVVARAQDVHWYRFVPDVTGLYMIATRGPISTDGVVLDAQGRAVPSQSSRVLPFDRNFALQLSLVRGQPYYLRISADGDEVGRYTLRFIYSGSLAPMPESLTLSHAALNLEVGDRARLVATVQPEGSLNELLWVSTNPRVASVTETGQVLAVRAGECEVFALGFGRAAASCKISVSAVALESVQFNDEALRLPVGERMPLSVTLVPQNAGDAALSYESSDARIATVDDQGNLMATGVGEATVTVSAGGGAIRDALRVAVVEPPGARRALIIGEQRYIDGRLRIGAVNTAQGMADLLRTQSFDGAVYDVTMRMDTGRAEAIEAIREVFKDAKPGDISLFAINCHGGYENGTPYLEFHDGSRLTAQGLEGELRKIPGTVVVILDCCNSGAFISRMERNQFTSRMLAAFGTDRSGSLGMSKYRVICSSSATQQSYRISPEGIKSEAYLSTALARALCMAGGWDLVGDRKMSMKADADRDGSVTLEEAYQYAYRRVKLDLEDAADMQDVQMYPRGSQFVLFSRD